MDNLEVDGLIDGVNLTKLYAESIDKTNSTLVITNNITTNHIEVLGSVTVNNLFNGLNLTKTYEDALLKNGNQTIYGPLNTENLIVEGQLEVEMVNGHNFSEEVIKLDQPGHISSHFEFQDFIHVSNIQTSLLNERNLSDFLSNIVFIDENATITGNKTFTSDLITKNLVLEGLINNLNLTKMITTTLLKNSNQTIKVPTKFKHLILELNAESTLINGINLSELEKRLVYKCYGPQRDIEGSHKYAKTIATSTSSIKNITIEGLVDSVNLTKFVDELVTRDGDHTITGKKNLMYLNTNHLEVESINGFQFPEDFIGINETNVTIYGKKTFYGSTTVKHNITLLPNKTVNGYDLSEFAKNVVTVNGDDVIETDVVFAENVTIIRDLNVGTINNVSVSKEELLLRTMTQDVVTGHKTFSQLTVKGNVETVEDINGYNLENMYSETIMANQVNIITGSKTINGSVFVLGKFN